MNDQNISSNDVKFSRLNFLTDFDGALSGQVENDEREEYLTLRQELYLNLEDRRDMFGEVVQETKRLKTQKSTKEDETSLKNPLKDDLEVLRQNYFMKQSWDKSMTHAEIAKLDEVIVERKSEEERLVALKESREIAKRQRDQKLKLL